MSTRSFDECPRRLCRDPDIGGPVPRTLFAGSDGCGVPVFSLTLYEAAWLYASLGSRGHLLRYAECATP